MAAQQASPFGLRLPEALRETIREAAHRNRRSMNAEIVFHLEAIFAQREQVAA